MTLMIVFVQIVFVSVVAFAGPAEKAIQRVDATPMMKESGGGSMTLSGAESKTPRMGSSGMMFHRSQRLSKVIGSTVFNKDGAHLGHIEDLITDEGGRISYLVLARGGVLGMGAKLVAIPITAVPPQIADDGKFILDVQLAAIDAAPTFTAANFPDFSNRKWQQEARGYFRGSETRGTEMKGPTGTRAYPRGY
jgi:sporulation protein YlmC with PRC-barrel domain